jgi:hypothetical protein
VSYSSASQNSWTCPDGLTPNQWHATDQKTARLQTRMFPESGQHGGGGGFAVGADHVYSASPLQRFRNNHCGPLTLALLECFHQRKFGRTAGQGAWCVCPIHKKRLVCPSVAQLIYCVTFSRLYARPKLVLNSWAGKRWCRIRSPCGLLPELTRPDRPHERCRKFLKNNNIACRAF